MNFINYIKKNTKKKIGYLIFIITLILWSVFLMYYSPQKIISKIGNQNAYIISFLSALIGGTSILFPFPYYLFVLTFGSGGANPFILGISAGVGLIIGDSTSYLIGYKGKEILPDKLNVIFKKLYFFCNNSKYKWFIPIFLFFYGAIIPLPNDVIVISLGLVKYPYLKLIMPLGLGSIVFNTILAFAGFYGLSSFFL
ncbi:MAG: hypothetical protein QXW97_03420 [Candidatus Pacearchaeota archaeon]